MINLLPFVVILYESKSKPLRIHIEHLQARKTHGTRIVYYASHSRKFRIIHPQKNAYLASSFYYQYN